jgi:hypothetical protein
MPKKKLPKYELPPVMQAAMRNIVTDKILENVQRDIGAGDLTAVDELIKMLWDTGHDDVRKLLLGYLPEGED